MKKTIILFIALTLSFFLFTFRGNTTVNPANPHSAADIGDIIQFGGLDWHVLDVKDGKALLITENIILRIAYNLRNESITWENSSLREYLNGSFHDNTFSDEEKLLILESTIVNNDNPWFGTDGGSDTLDKLFLLSIEEAVHYFGDSGQLGNRLDDASFIDDRYSSERAARYAEIAQYSWWWLRSSGGNSNSAAIVDADGSIGLSGNNVHFSSGSLRAALWLCIVENVHNHKP